MLNGCFNENSEVSQCRKILALKMIFFSLRSEKHGNSEKFSKKVHSGKKTKEDSLDLNCFKQLTSKDQRGDSFEYPTVKNRTVPQRIQQKTALNSKKSMVKPNVTTQDVQKDGPSE